MNETHIRGINFFKSTDIKSVKADLSAKEMSSVQKRVQGLMVSLDELTDLLRGSTLFLANGKLLTGGVSFAAFRIQTISLIFEYAHAYFTRGSDTGTYREFLRDLGRAVGFTYARQLLKNLRLEQRIPADDYALVELWALFENDTGAGVTTVNKIDAQTLEISLKNNPLGYYYGRTGEHSHCDFYCEYYRTIVNEFLTTRPRLARDFMPDLKPPFWKVAKVDEHPRRDLCVFECNLRHETLTPAFDLLHTGLRDMEEGKYGDAIASVREALTVAQKEKLVPSEKEVPKNLYKAFQSLLPRKTFKLMDEAYQRASGIVHKTRAKDPAVIEEIIRDICYCTYEIEGLDITREQLKQVQSNL